MKNTYTIVWKSVCLWAAAIFAAGMCVDLLHVLLTDQYAAYKEYWALAAGSGERAEEYAEKALQKWLGAEQYTHIFVRHSEIDATADAFYDLMQSLSGGEYDGIEQAYSKLLYHLSSIATMEQISLGSIM